MNIWDWADGGAASLRFRRAKELEAEGDPEGASRMIGHVEAYLADPDPPFGTGLAGLRARCVLWRGAGAQVDRGPSLV